MTLAAFRSKAGVLLLFIHCLLLLSFGVGVLCWVLVLCLFLGVLSSLAIVLLRKRKLVVL